jgi:hypothetical protein
MAKQTFTTGQVLTAAQMTSLQQTAMLGGAASAKTASYTLVAADAGTAISMSNASATTITVNTALFAAGDTVQITNLGAGVCTITAGTATVNTSASLALAQYESGTLTFTSTSAAIFVKGAGAAATSGGMTLISTTTASGATVTLSSIPQTYNSLFLVITNLTNGTGAQSLYINPNASATLAYGISSNNEANTVFTRRITDEPIYNTTSYLNTGGVNLHCLTIDNYTSSSSYKSFFLNGYATAAGPTAVSFFTGGGIKTNTAITSIALTGSNSYSFTAGTILLYGVK